MKMEIASKPLEVYSAMPKLVGRKDYIAFYNFIKFLHKLKTPEPLLFKSAHKTVLYGYVGVEETIESIIFIENCSLDWLFYRSPKLYTYIQLFWKSWRPAAEERL
jgi:hypothetical protein